MKGMCDCLLCLFDEFWKARATTWLRCIYNACVRMRMYIYIRNLRYSSVADKCHQTSV